MKKIVVLSQMALLCLSAAAQDTIPQKPLEEVVVYSNKFLEKKKNVVQKIDIISEQRIAQMNAQNTGDLLINTGNVFVQKSQQGGSSPVLRGFEASRVLLVVDGIRMNNAIYRSGHLQNVITVDQNMLERVEILYGPASTLYGSDALGGVIHLRTKTPQLSINRPLYITGSAMARYSSANNEKTGHVDFNLGGKKMAWLQSYNYSDFDDLKMGGNYPDAYPNFGRRTEYITTINGVDSIVRNPDDRVQKFSGYKQWDITQKLLFQPSLQVTHLLNLQYSNSSDVPRYDRLQDRRNGVLRYAEWYYGPQLRALAAYELNVTDLGPFDQVKSIMSYQKIQESRNQREYRRYDRLDRRTENLNVWAWTIDGRKLWNSHELTVGLDAQLNDVQSTAFRENVLTGGRSKLDSRYPDGSNNMNYFGGYFQHIWKSNNGKIVLNDGLRLQGTSLRSTIADNSFFNFPFSTIQQSNLALTGNAGIVYMPTTLSRITFGFSSGFRAPNIDDLAKIFESNTASKQLIVPNADIDPEYTYNLDLGFSHQFSKSLVIDATTFYTWFTNAIALAPFRFQEKDSILYNGIMTKAFANQNVNSAYVYGASGNLTINFSPEWKLFSTISFTKGRLQPLNGVEVPLDHIPPVFGKTAVTYSAGNLSAELYSLYNGWKRISDYNPSGEDNAQYATPEGTPSWATLNLKSTVRIFPKLSVQVGVENIFDRNYRYFASGFSAPGRNVIIAVRSNF